MIAKRRLLIALTLLPLAAHAQQSLPPQSAPQAQAPLTATPAQPRAPTDVVAARPRHQAPQLPPLDPTNPYSEKITAAAHTLAAQLTDDQAKALAQVRINDGMIGAVDTAAHDVHLAIDSCDAHNPDLKPALDHHFADWHKAVDPVLALQRKELGGVITAGLAGPPKQVNDYLDLVDKAAAFADSRIEKHPATSDQACTGLLASMDRTKGALAKALMSMKWPTKPATPPPTANAAPNAQTPGVASTVANTPATLLAAPASAPAAPATPAPAPATPVPAPAAPATPAP